VGESKDNEVRTAERMVKGFIRHRPSLAASEPCSTPHLDEDALTAFVESRLSEVEARPMVSHLVQCEVCRRASAELLELAEVFQADEPGVIPGSTVAEPGGLRRFLEDLVSRIVGSDEQAVLAYHSGEDAKNHKEEQKRDEKKLPQDEDGAPLNQ
jgi:hypothetical protein